METTISDLPDEMIEHILSLLTFEDRKSARLVCKRWQLVSFAPRFIKNEIIKFKSWMDLNEISPTSRHANVTVEELAQKHPNAVSAFWERHGRYIETLKLPIIELVYPVLRHILTCCRNVESIVLTGGYFNIAPNEEVVGVSSVTLSKLRNLELHLMEFMPQNVFDVIQALFGNMPKLEKFRLIDFYANNGVESNAERITQLTLSLVKTASATLKELDLSPLNLSDDIFQQIIDLVGAQLTSLSIGHAVNDFKLNAIADKCTRLQKFSRIGIDHISCSNTTIRRLVNCLKQSTDVCLRYLNLIEVQPPAAANLVSLNLEHTNVTAENLSAAFSVPHTMLEKLNLNDLPCINSAVLKVICPNVPNLIYLSLDDCRIENSALQEICTFNKKLSYLSLNAYRSAYLNDGTMNVAKFNELTQLAVLNLRGRNLTGLTSLALPNLHSIVLYDVPLTEADIRSLVENCTTLYDILTMPEIDISFRYILKDRERALESRGYFRSEFYNSFFRYRMDGS